MKATVERLPGHRARLDIEVDVQRMEEAVERAYQRVRKQVEIPGFRRGRAPRSLVERHVGSDLLHREALEEVVPEAYREAVQTTEIEPVDSPEFDLEGVEAGQPLRFTVEVVIRPDVELPELDSLVAEWERVDDGEARIEEYVAQELERLREEHATLETVDEELADGLYAIVDCHGHAHGKHYDELSGEGITVGIGTGGFLPGFDGQLVGAAAGDERIVEIVLPDGLEDEELAAAEARFDVTIKEVKERLLPEVDDAFAAEVSEHETLDELRTSLGEAVEEAMASERDRRQRDAAVAALIEAAEPDIPEAMLQNRVADLLRETEQDFQSRNMSLDDYLAQTGQTRDELAVQLRPRAQRQVAAELVLDALCRDAGLQADDEELDDELDRIGQPLGRTAQALREFVLTDHHLEQIRATVGRQKAARHLVEQVTLRDVEPQEPEPQAEQAGAAGQAAAGREDLWVPGGAEGGAGRQGLWVPGDQEQEQD